MSLGQLKPVAPSAASALVAAVTAGERAMLALVRDSSAPAVSHEGAAAADALARWKRLCDRLESVAVENDLSAALGCWLRIGAEPLGASGGIVEVHVAGCGGGETLRASFGLDERSSRAMSGAAVDGGVLPMPSTAELVVDLAHSDAFGSLLVRPFLDQDGVVCVLSAPLRSRAAFVGVLRYCFAQPIATGDTACVVAELLAQRIAGLVEARLGVRRALAAESRLHAVLDGAGAPILTAAPDGSVIEGNDAAAALFGYQRGELRGVALSALFPCGSAELVSTDPNGARLDPRVFELDAERRDGSTFVADVVVGAGALQHGRTLVVRDATARRTADAKMRQCERVASIGTVAAGLGHDLNNTLLPMRAHLSALARSAGPGAAAGRERHAGELRAGLEHLQSLADALHFLACDTEPRACVATDIAGWWSLAGPLLEKALHERAALEIAFDRDLPRVILDERALSRVVLGMLVNAGEAMPRERPRELARVLMRARRAADGGAVVLEIADNGIGMNDEVRRRAFDAYFTTKIRGLGTGLGLPIARSIVESAGGRIELDTQPGVGTTVRIVLPAERAGGAPQPRVACTIRDGRLSSAVHGILATNGVDALEENPLDADIWIVGHAEVAAEDLARWCAAHTAEQLLILCPEAGEHRGAQGVRGATVVSTQRGLSSISAAIKQALASASTASVQRGASHG